MFQNCVKNFRGAAAALATFATTTLPSCQTAGVYAGAFPTQVRNLPAVPALVQQHAPSQYASQAPITQNNSPYLLRHDRRVGYNGVYDPRSYDLGHGTSNHRVSATPRGTTTQHSYRSADSNRPGLQYSNYRVSPNSFSGSQSFVLPGGDRFSIRISNRGVSTSYRAPSLR